MGFGGDLADVPAPGEHFLVRRDVIADQRQHLHYHVLGHADHVAACDLGHGDVPLRRRRQIEMIGSYSRGKKEA